MRRFPLFIAFLLLIFGLIYLLFTLQITTQSKIAGYSLKVDRFQFVQFLINNNYYKGEGVLKTADVTLTPEKQPYMAVTKNLSLPPFQSVTIKNNQKGMSILAYYDRSVLEEILSYGENGQKRINTDALAYICVAQTRTKTGLYEKEDCYKRAINYLESNPTLIFRLEKASQKTGFHLVGIAHAAYCTGLVECEPGVTTCVCSVGGTTCSIGNTPCGPFNAGTCNCTFTCTGSGGGALQDYYCSSNTTQLSCTTSAGAAQMCQSLGLCKA